MHPYDKTRDDALSFQLHYEVLPSSVISRFIVRMYPYIREKTYWRTGVLLKRGNNEALVKADHEEKIITIHVRGSEQTRRELLSNIRFELGGIHTTIPRLKVAEKVSIPGHPEVVVNYQHLVNLETLGEPSFVPD